MKIIGQPTLESHPEKPGLFVVKKGFRAVRGNWTLRIEPGLVINGASIPPPFCLFLDRLHPDYNRPSIIHDALVGEFGLKAFITDKYGTKRRLTWKEAAVWFREAMKAEGAPKVKRRLFYHAVMLKKRVRI
ncbi:MAG: hypothetical protein CL811_07320 [Colwelliaceae bacterium]|nr:hypothetical protein [Colwelliaceae bacterium]